MKLRLLVLFGVFFAVTCTPPVVFDQAYPIGQEDLKELPKDYKGAFICESDSSLLIIGNRDITIRKESYFTLPLKYIEEREDCNMDGQEIFVSGRAECIPVEFVNDSTVRGLVVEHDTLFNMGEKSVARMYEGHVVLSNELQDDQWGVSFLSLEKNGDVKYRAITDKSAIKNVGKVTRMEDITTIEDKHNRYKIKPTMKQFDVLMKDEKVFIECEYLTRVNYENVPSEPIIIKGINN